MPYIDPKGFSLSLYFVFISRTSDLSLLIWAIIVSIILTRFSFALEGRGV